MKTIFLSLLALSFTLFSCTFSSNTSTSSKTSNSTRTFNGGELRYNETITDDQANALGDYLVKSEFFDGNPITVQVGKVNNVIHFSMILNDKDAYSEEYQTLGKVMIGELEEKVFKDDAVELDWCDEDFKVKKNVKIGMSTVVATNVSHTESGSAADLLPGNWICSNIYGGKPEDEVSGKDLKVLRTNFSLEFGEDASISAKFVNPDNIKQPMDMKGMYAIDDNKITFKNLIIDGKPAPEDLVFVLTVTNNELKLIIEETGEKDFVMSFERTP